MEVFYEWFDTEIGKLTISCSDEKITRISFGEIKIEKAKKNPVPLLVKAYDQLVEYFDGKRKAFDLPLEPRGTKFQQEVWNALCGIPYGETKSYSQIAKEVGNPKACRAVGMANNKNPIAIVIPCHRVIGQNGKLTGYAGGLGIKERLLELEKR